MAIPLVVAHRFLTEVVLGMEIRPKTKIGPGLTIYHGFGIVLNDHCVLGRNVVLRNGVTIGHKEPGQGAPVIGDDVSLGVNSLVIGNITVGAGTSIGAGAVVLKSAPENAVLVGNPARDISTRA
ncbi:serine O-acetyltransferase [Microbacterium enclense]|uniref:serine O-acetyltransferase n=1 Tax=Microbacterium enclense TaxID=993073 RepID=UPI0036DBA71F